MKFFSRVLISMLILFILLISSVTAQDTPVVKTDSPAVTIKKDSVITKQAVKQPVKKPVEIKPLLPDSTILDTIPTVVSKKPDSIGRISPLEKFKPDSGVSVYGFLSGGYIGKHPYFHAAAKAVMMVSLERNLPATDWIFYLFAGLLFYLALLKLIFPKYFNDLFRVFFNTALRQKQIREQLIQEPLPSLFLNIFFVFSGAVFAYFLLTYYGMAKRIDNHWIILGFCVLALIVIYLVKFLFIRFMGWILARRDEAETYNFVVFMVNKIAGFLLLPAGLLLAVTEPGWSKTVLFFCYLLLGVLLIYRWARAFQLVHKGLKINQIHLIMFVVSFEIIPILVLYKVLFNLFG